MIAYIDLPIHLWGEDLSIAAYILNGVKTKANHFIPYEHWTRCKLYLSNLKFGAIRHMYLF